LEPFPFRPLCPTCSAALGEVEGTVEGVPTSPGLVRAKQTERLVAALLPPAAVPGPRPLSAPSGGVTLPLLPQPHRARLVHRLTLLDDHGRVREATLFDLLGWKPGTLVEVREVRGRLVARTATTDGVPLDPRGRLRVPDAYRKFRGWAAGDAVVLSLDADEQSLVISSSSLLDALVVFDVSA